MRKIAGGYGVFNQNYFNTAKEYYQLLPEGKFRNYLLGELHIIEAVKKFNNLTAMTFCIKKAYELLNQQHSILTKPFPQCTSMEWRRQFI